MRAVAVQPRAERIELVDVAEPPLVRPSDVRVRILEVGICGTDKEICRFDYGTPPPGEDHLIIGHEALGEVVETGRAVSQLEVGDLVVPMVRRPCQGADCVPCGVGQQDFCASGDFSERGIKEAHGFMAESIVEEERFLQKVPAGLRDVAVLVEPLTIAEKALRQVWDVQERLPWAAPGRKRRPYHALVLGAGPVGCSVRWSSLDLDSRRMCSRGSQLGVRRRASSRVSVDATILRGRRDRRPLGRCRRYRPRVRSLWSVVACVSCARALGAERGVYLYRRPGAEVADRNRHCTAHA